MKDDERPLVGIALLAYNYGKYIDEAIESLKLQTFQDFEVFLIDDGSNDGFTYEKLQSIQYDKITKKYLYLDNAGNAKRRRQMYEKMKNKYIMDMSGDDKLAPEFLSKTVEYLDRNPEYGAVSVNILEYMDDFSREPFYELKYDKRKMKLPDMLAECHFLGSSLMRRKALDGTDLSGGFRRYLDWDKWISMLEAGWKLGVVPEPLFYYRVHSDSLSHSSTAEAEAEVFAMIIKKHETLYRKYAPVIEKKLFCDMFGAVRNQDGLLRENIECKNTIKTLQRQIGDLNEELRISRMTFTNRMLRKLKKILH